MFQVVFLVEYRILYGPTVVCRIPVLTPTAECIGTADGVNGSDCMHVECSTFITSCIVFFDYSSITGASWESTNRGRSFAPLLSIEQFSAQPNLPQKSAGLL